MLIKIKLLYVKIISEGNSLRGIQLFFLIIFFISLLLETFFPIKYVYFIAITMLTMGVCYLFKESHHDIENKTLSLKKIVLIKEVEILDEQKSLNNKIKNSKNNKINKVMKI